MQRLHLTFKVALVYICDNDDLFVYTVAARKVRYVGASTYALTN